jgi:hypothetical protein
MASQTSMRALQAFRQAKITFSKSAAHAHQSPEDGRPEIACASRHPFKTRVHALSLVHMRKVRMTRTLPIGHS